MPLLGSFAEIQEGGRAEGLIPKYQLHDNSITTSIERQEKGETLPGVASFSLLFTPTPAAAVGYYLSRIKTSGLVLRMSSLSRALRDPIEFQTSYLMLLPDLVRLCDLLWIREQWREQRRGGIKEFLLQWSHIPPEITHPSPHPAFLSLL